MTTTFAPGDAVGTGTTATAYTRPVWQLAVASFLPARLRDSAWLDRLPLLIALAVQLVFLLRMDNTAFQDEALYVNAGHDVVAHLLHGTPMPPYGTYLSGAPAFYPVLAAMLDTVGGLGLVRLFSALCVLAMTVIVHDLTRRVAGRRAAAFAVLLFALSGSVAFVGELATYDALCAVLVAVAAYLALTRDSFLSATFAGVALTAAATAKYAGGAYVPVVACLALAAPGTLGRRLGRATTAGFVAVAGLAGLYALWGGSLRDGIAFTTTARHALIWQSYGELGKTVAWDVGILALLAVAGAVVLWRRPRGWLLTLGLGAGAAVLPASQIRIHEFVSLDKHLGYSAFFLVIPAAVALARIDLRSWRLLVVVALVWLSAIGGLWRSNGFYHGWPNVSAVVTVLENHHPPGDYIALEADTFRYYARDLPDVRWSTAYGIYANGPDAVRGAVADGVYRTWIYRTGDMAPAAYQPVEQVLAAALKSSGRYRLVASSPVAEYHTGRWYVWQRTD